MGNGTERRTKKENMKMEGKGEDRRTKTIFFKNSMNEKENVRRNEKVQEEVREKTKEEIRNGEQKE